MATYEKRKTADGITTYRVKIRLKGYPTQTASFEKLSDAKEWAAETESEMKKGRYIRTIEAKKRTLGELIDKYIKQVIPTKTKSAEFRSSQTRQLNWWKAELGSYLLIQVTPSMIADKRDKLLASETFMKSKMNPATVNRYMAAISHAYTIAIKEWGWVETNPVNNVKKLKEPRGRIRFLDDDERTRLLEACKNTRNQCLYIIVVMALSTGARKAEILNLKWQDIDFKRGIVTLHETKNGERRILPIKGLCMELLQAHADTRQNNTDYVFPSQLSGKVMDIRTVFSNVVDRAGLKDFRFHDLRHSAASYLAMNGASLTEIAEVLGHKTLQMVKRYSHLSEAHTASVVERMNSKIFG